MITKLIETLARFATLLEQHHDFELYAFKIFEPLSMDQIQNLENGFHKQLVEIEPSNDLSLAASYFMPYDSNEKRLKLQIPDKPWIIPPLLSDFYRKTNGLQFVWGYKKIRNFEKLKTSYHISKYTCNKQSAPWERWNSISHHWSLGSIFVPPLEVVLSQFAEGNLRWADKKSSLIYPVVPFDFYDDWGTAALLLNENEPINEVVIGEDSMASFYDASPHNLQEYIERNWIHHKGSILLRKKHRIQMSSDHWSLDELAQKIAYAEEIGNWGMI